MACGCMQCPRKCGVERPAGVAPKRALCRAGGEAEVALVSLHRWEEPCISGDRGAGTVCFSHCNLRCCFCQNREISAEGKGIRVTDERLAEIFLEQQARGVSCLDLVSPTQYTENIIRALDAARTRGFSLPVAWNSNGYELPEMLELLRGRVSGRAIEKMHGISGPVEIGPDGLMKRGVIVRHLVLPGLWHDSCRVLDWLWERFGNGIYVSLMNQYMPLFKACRHPEINRRLLTLEYQKVVRHARALGFRNCYIQIGQTAESKFIPVFDGTNALKG